MPRFIARKPVSETRTYLKYGLVIVKHEYQLCPRCWHVLNAGPNYQPDCCGQCGQKIDFSAIEWKEDEYQGFAKGRTHEQIKS